MADEKLPPLRRVDRDDGFVELWDGERLVISFKPPPGGLDAADVTTLTDVLMRIAKRNESKGQA